VKWQAPSSQKLVAFLQGRLGGDYSGKFLRKLLEANLCRINGKVERFGSRLILRGDTVELASTWKSLLDSQSSVTFETLYESEALKIVNKPPGWVCDPKNTLKTFGPNHYLVHRLDKETSGLLLIAKNSACRDELIDLFEKRTIHKTYLALVDGVPKESKGIRQTFLQKKGSFQGQTIWGSGLNGLSAITHWQKMATFQQASLILCEPVTGRTHQIRVHMAEMGHPILVDRQYAKSFRCPLFIQRTLLHAYRLQFTFQDQKIDIKAPLFLDMRNVLSQIGMNMGHFAELFRKEEKNHGGDQGHDHKHAEKVVEPSHLSH
jgi:23S rRNA pseudouridine955/2504/2580 synthase